MMTWSHAFRPPPLRQGELDHLCGLYAIANGVRLLLGMLPTRIGTALLFQELVRLAGSEVDLQAALTHGIEAPDLWRIVKATAGSIARNRGVRIVADRPFPSRSRPSPDTLRREVAAGVRTEGAVYLVGLRGGFDHWTVVRRATPRALFLYDSGPLRRIDVDPEGRAIIDLDPGREYRFEGSHIFRLRLAHRMTSAVSSTPRRRSTTTPTEEAA